MVRRACVEVSRLCLEVVLILVKILFRQQVILVLEIHTVSNVWSLLCVSSSCPNVDVSAKNASDAAGIMMMTIGNTTAMR